MKSQMRIVLLLIPLFMIVCGNVAHAQGHDDLFGLYTAPDATGKSYMDIAPGDFGKIYLCLRNGTDLGGCWAWECLFEIPSNMIVTQWDMTWGLYNQYGPLNIATPPEFIVGIGVNPIPWDEFACIMTIHFMVTDSNPAPIFIHPSSIPSIPGCPVYVGFSNPNLLLPLDWACGDEQTPAFTINGGTDKLMCDCSSISSSKGCVVDFHLEAGPANANRNYFLAGSATGTSGILLPGGRYLPLTWDSVTNYILRNYNNAMLGSTRCQWLCQGHSGKGRSSPGCGWKEAVLCLYHGESLRFSVEPCGGHGGSLVGGVFQRERRPPGVKRRRAR